LCIENGAQKIPVHPTKTAPTSFVGECMIDDNRARPHTQIKQKFYLLAMVLGKLMCKKWCVEKRNAPYESYKMVRRKPLRTLRILFN